MSSGDTVLIYRLGSIGDFVVSLPCLYKVRGYFRGSRIVLLASTPNDPLAVKAEDILANTSLVDDFIYYTAQASYFSQIVELRKSIKSLRPRLLVYLVARKGLTPVLRDISFFEWCGIRKIIGAPLSADARYSRKISIDPPLWESEGERLARQLSYLGPIDCTNSANWDLRLTDRESCQARQLLLDFEAPLGNAANGRCAIAISVGTKQAVKDWGDWNWQQVLRGLENIKRPLLLIGGRADFGRSEALASKWPHGHLNLCGSAPPRVSAALLRRAAFFLGHDSGPMHLAAAVGTPCVAIFSSKKNRPGEWYPFGVGHKMLHPWRRPPIEPIEVVAAAQSLAKEIGIL